MKAYAIQFLIELIYRLGNIKINKKKKLNFLYTYIFYHMQKSLAFVNRVDSSYI